MARQHALPGVNARLPLTVLSAGLGVESSALTVLCYEDARFSEYRPDYIVHSDTGCEMPHTTDVVLPAMNRYLAAHGQQVAVIAPDSDLRAPSKRGPLDVVYRNQPKPGIPTRSLRSCTVNHKIVPIRKWITAKDDRRWGRWRKLGGRHVVLVGIAADEADRCDGQMSYVDPSAQYIEVRYPLVEHGVTRAECYDVLRDRDLPALKSGCFCCPFQPMRWWYAIRELYPDLHQRSVEMEADALTHNPKLTLTGDKPLDEMIDEWEAQRLQGHGHLPDPEHVLRDEYLREDGNWCKAA